MMVRTLYLIRHAEASDRHATQLDRDRALTLKGNQDARSAGVFLSHQGLPIDAIYHSPAKRTTETAYAVNESILLPTSNIIEVESIYAAGVDTLIEIIKGFDDSHTRSALVGHNPAISALAGVLSHDGIPPFVPCAIAMLHFDLPHWRDMGRGTARGKLVYAPYY